MNKLELEITSKAYNDIEIITDYIAQDNKNAANKLAKLFYETFQVLCLHPNIGNYRKDFTYMDVKFYVLKKHYLIVYRIIDNTKLRVLRVLTAYQDICSQL